MSLDLETLRLLYSELSVPVWRKTLLLSDIFILKGSERIEDLTFVTGTEGFWVDWSALRAGRM